MGWLLNIALRIAPLRKLKARRTELLLDKSLLLAERRRFLGSPDVDAGPWSDISYRTEKRIDGELDAINGEIGRRGR